jgi:predicted nuclease of predicted toxin-antitoxin system
LRFFIDECLSPILARRLNATGEHDAAHPRDYGRLGERDDTILTRCVAEDRIIVTENARDFRKLVGAAPIHPGLIILASVGREATWRLLSIAIADLLAQTNPDQAMINRVLELGPDGHRTYYDLPAR